MNNINSSVCHFGNFGFRMALRERLIGSLQVDALSLVVDECVVMVDCILLLGMRVLLE